MEITQEQVNAGQAVYTKRTLSVYDLVVLGISNKFIWKCPTPKLIEHYNQHITDNHLDVGVGTGYFLDRCTMASESPRIALMDLNQETLNYASNRITRYKPETYQRNVLEPIEFDQPLFDSVGVNYLLHCLPGTMQSKTVLFGHLHPLMNEGATVFGSTLLHNGVPRSALAKRLMAVYNKKGIFSNTHDDLDALKTGLENHFNNVDIKLIGCAAVFSAKA